MERVAHWLIGMAHLPPEQTALAMRLLPVILGYITSALSLLLGAYLVWRAMPKAVRSHYRGFWRYVLPSEWFRHPSSWADGAITAMYLAKSLLGLVPAFLAATWVADHLRPFAGFWIGAGHPAAAPVWMLGLFMLANVVIVDFAFYYSHYLTHRVPFLWEFHKVHHSAELLSPVTSYRVHPVDDMFGDATAALLVGVNYIVFARWIDLDHVSAAAFGIGAIYWTRLVTLHDLRHSHIQLRFPDPASLVLMSPVHHQLHHSSDPRHHDANFGFVSTVWDRLFGTYVEPKAWEEFPLGLAHQEERQYGNRFLVLMFLPMLRALQLCLPKRAAPAWVTAEPVADPGATDAG